MKSILTCKTGDVIQEIHHRDSECVLKEFRFVSVIKTSAIEYEVKGTYGENDEFGCRYWCREDGTGTGSKNYLRF